MVEWGRAGHERRARTCGAYLGSSAFADVGELVNDGPATIIIESY
jgi:hypothetical protein